MNQFFTQLISSCKFDRRELQENDQPNPNFITNIVGGKEYTFEISGLGSRTFTFVNEWWTITIEQRRRTIAQVLREEEPSIEVKINDKGLQATFMFERYNFEEGIDTFIAKYHVPKQNLVLRYLIFLS